MRNLVIAAATAATLALSMGAANAFPVLPAAGIDAAPAVTLVSGGCGPYRHRGPFGECRPNFGGYGYYHRPYGFYGPRFGYGYHRFHRFHNYY